MIIKIDGWVDHVEDILKNSERNQGSKIHQIEEEYDHIERGTLNSI